MKLKNKISVFVSQENISQSRNFKGNPCLCPIARAVCDKYNLKENCVYISPVATIFDGQRELYYKFSDDAVKFITDFDSGLFVDPITIEANLVREYVRQ